MIPESIAAICHEANRRYCHEIGERDKKSWEESSWATRQSAIAGVIFYMQNPNAEDADMHDQWLTRKLEEGWKYGPVLNESVKEHPCVLPYDKLPMQQKIKDALFRHVARTFIIGDAA